jgi:hypothetical protein
MTRDNEELNALIGEVGGSGMKSKAFKLPKELAELSVQALWSGHRIKLSKLLKPVPSREEIEAEEGL